MRKLSFTFFLITIISFSGFSQSADDKTWLTFSIDNNQYGSIIRVPFEDMLSVSPISFTAGVEQYLSASFNLEATLSIGKVESLERVRANMFTLEVMPKFKLANGKILKESSVIKPFLGLGLGMVNFSDSSNDGENGSALLISPTAGIEMDLSPNAKIFASIAYKIGGNESINFRQYSLGLAFSLKKKMDSDGDGIADKKDACPQEPGTKEYKGCAAPLVTDQTQEQPVETSVEPQQNEVVKTDPVSTTAEKKAIEPEKPVDSDGDGIPDNADLCPNQAGTEANVGCPVVERTPEVQPEPVAIGPVYELPLASVTFDEGSDRIGQSSRAGLDALAALMQTDESFKLKLVGYGDSGRDAAENSELARKRAQALKAYLVAKGRSPYRFIINAVGNPGSPVQSGKVFIEVIE